VHGLVTARGGGVHSVGNSCAAAHCLLLLWLGWCMAAWCTEEECNTQYGVLLRLMLRVVGLIEWCLFEQQAHL
jgi:hypothetical protein